MTDPTGTVPSPNPTLNFLRTGDRGDQKAIRSGGRIYWGPRPAVECVDGFTISVQAGEYLYCSPRANDGPWSAMECGFPSERPEPWAEWRQYVEDAERPTDTVYGYVPVSLIEALIESHGGVK